MHANKASSKTYVTATLFFTRMRAGHVWDAYEHYLGTELYCNKVWMTHEKQIQGIWPSSGSSNQLFKMGIISYLKELFPERCRYIRI